MASHARGALLAALALGTLAQFAAAQIRIVAPQDLAQEFASDRGDGWIRGSTATFGAPFYGDRFFGRISYGPSLKNEHHCTPEDYEVEDKDRHNKETRLLHIVVVRRGGDCSLTTKVRVAQEKGAHAVIVVDKEESDLTDADMPNVLFTDDGYGAAVHIPSVFISKEAGRKLIAAAVMGPVMVELMWKLPLNNVVKLDWWMSSSSVESYQLLKDFAPKRRILNEVMNFQPHFAVFGVDDSQRMNAGLCIDDSEGGRICAQDPDGKGPITGEDVLKEDARQLCIHEVHKVKHHGTYLMGRGAQFSEKFWAYVERFLESCPVSGRSPFGSFGSDCSHRLMIEVGIDTDRVKACLHANMTRFLKRERDNQAWSPRALRINGWRYSGIFDAELIAKAICSGYTQQPPECEGVVQIRNPFEPYVTKVQEGTSMGQLLKWFLMLSSIMLMLMLLYRRHINKEMRVSVREEVMLEVQAQMAQYTRMGGNGKV